VCCGGGSEKNRGGYVLYVRVSGFFLSESLTFRVFIGAGFVGSRRLKMREPRMGGRTRVCQKRK
jgi:hypothetical protein